MSKYIRTREMLCFNDEASIVHKLNTSVIVGFSVDVWTKKLDEYIDGVFVNLLRTARALNKHLHYYYIEDNQKVCDVFSPTGEFISRRVL